MTLKVPEPSGVSDRGAPGTVNERVSGHYWPDSRRRYFLDQVQGAEIKTGTNARKFRRRVEPADVIVEFGCDLGLKLAWPGALNLAEADHDVVSVDEVWEAEVEAETLPPGVALESALPLEPQPVDIFVPGFHIDSRRAAHALGSEGNLMRGDRRASPPLLASAGESCHVPTSVQGLGL